MERRIGLPGLVDRLARTADRPAPLFAVDLPAFDANAAELLRRAGVRPVRLATKSVRVPALVERALAAGFEGLMTYSAAEALWWAARGATDVLVGYPSADHAALAGLLAGPARDVVTLMVDDVAHLDLLTAAGAGPAAPVRVCLDVDASLRLGRLLPEARRLHLGVRRSPLREPAAVAALAAEATRRGLVVRGLMFYEAQVAGLPDTSPAVRAVKRASLAQLAGRRSAVVAAVTAEVGALGLVNGGGTGSLAATARDPAVTELTAGSGLLAPGLFDGYREPLVPAGFIGLDVVRRPAPGIVTVFSGGFAASGPAGRDRSPAPVLPPGLRLLRSEGAGEVQTPLTGPGTQGLAPGDRVWLRHAKAGEVMERFAEVVAVRDGGAEVMATYRGLGLTFG